MRQYFRLRDGLVEAGWGILALKDDDDFPGGHIGITVESTSGRKQHDPQSGGLTIQGI